MPSDLGYGATGRDRSAAPGFAIAALAVLALAAGLRFWALDAGLPHLMTRPDEEVVLEQTTLPARGRFDLGWSTYPSAYIYLCWAWGEVSIRLAQAAGWLAAGDYLSVLRIAPDRVLLLQRVLSALAGTAAVAVLLACARRAFGGGGALAAGVLLATSFLHVRDSHAVKPDALLSLAVLVVLATLVPLARRATLLRGAGVGLAIGLAMGVKYPAVVLLGSAYVAAWMGSRSSGLRRLLPAPAIVAGAVAVATFVAGSPYLLLNAGTRTHLLDLARFVFPQTSSQAALVPDIPGYPAYSGQPWWAGWVHHAVFSLRYGIGLLPTLLAPVAVAWGLATRRPLTVLAAVTAVLYFLVIGASPAMHTRYMTPLVPLLTLLEGGLVAAIASRCRGRWLPAAVIVTAVVALAAEPTASIVGHNRIAARTDTRVLATRWMASHLPAGATLVGLGNRVWFWGMPQIPPGVRFRTVTPEPDTLARAGIQYVLTHEHVLFSSRVDPEVMRALGPRLRLLADFDPFVSGGHDAVFETRDAYYIPMHGFGAVVRPGPRVRVYAFDATPEP